MAIIAKSMEVQPARPDDIPQLCELLEILFNEEVEFHSNRSAQTAGLEQIINFPERGQILVLRDGPVCAGMVNLLYTISTAMGGKAAILEDMVLRPEYRGSGAGSKLLHAAVKLAGNNGCRRITLLTDQGNEKVLSFYQHHGFFISQMVPMRLIFPQNGP